ncbi:MAG: polyprenyl synthetase family protein [Deltaproteobacteria bacterium]|nr:polyprenyl synthetase family protein [Deltaproteobacteria bacterium]
MDTAHLPPQDFAHAHAAALRLLSDEVGQVRQGVEDAAAGLPGPGGAAARLMTDRPGKLVRPLLVGLVHRALGGAGGRACADAAALVEIIHLSTLLHDDVVDEAPTRRGAPSAAAAMGNAAAVLGGDALVVRAMAQAHALGRDVVERTVHALQQLVTGELLQLRQRGDVDLEPAGALRVAALKTGALMRLCAEVGALTAGRELSHAVTLGEAFVHLGIAFQVADDVLDLAGSASVVGKAVGKDIAQGTVSFPLALALHAAPLHREALRLALRTGLDERGLGRVVSHAVARTHAVPRALQTAAAELDPVQEALAGLPASAARQVLAAVCAGLGRRDR